MGVESASPSRRAVGVTDVVGVIDRRLVHKQAIAEVLLTGIDANDRTATAAAQWPRRHQDYVLGRRYVPTVLLETLRQSVIAAMHVGQGVPLDWQFILQRLDVDVHPALMNVESAPADILIDLDRRTPDDQTRMQTWHARVWRSGRFLGEATGDAFSVPPGVYRRIRFGDRRPPVDGRSAASRPDAQSGRVVPLVVDTGHPGFFDHPLDHVPGMLMVQAAVGVAIQAGLEIGSIRSTFNRFADVDVEHELFVTDTTGPVRGLSACIRSTTGVPMAAVELAEPVGGSMGSDPCESARV